MERTHTEPECDRLRAVAIPELEAVDWLSAVGQPSEMPNEWGIWEMKVERGLLGFEQFFRDAKKFVGALHTHIDGTFPMPYAHRFRYDPFEEVVACYDQHSAAITAKIVAAGARFEWWTKWTERAVVFDAKYYAVTRAFDQTEKIQDYHPLPDYYVQAFRLYQAGRFPCGWTRKLDTVSNRWKKGRFVYI